MANEMRDRIVEMLNETFDAQYTKSVLITAEHTADHLIENGVVVPPCKVGDTVYVFKWKRKKTNGKRGYWVSVCTTTETLERAKKYGEVFIDSKKMSKCDYTRIGKTVFLTKSEAEQKLKEMRGE